MELLRMARFEIPRKMREWSLWAAWWFLVGGGALWLLVGSVAYWVKKGWLPPDAAGWVQAIGSVITLIVAVAIPIYQRFLGQRDKVTTQLERRKASFQQVRLLAGESQMLIANKTLPRSLYSTDEHTVNVIAEIVTRLNAVVAGSDDSNLLAICFDFREQLNRFQRTVSPRDEMTLALKRQFDRAFSSVIERLQAGLAELET